MLAARDRPVPEDVAQAVAELVARFGDALVGRPAVRARVAAVLDERDLGIAWGRAHGPSGGRPDGQGGRAGS